ncbi:hypothetical protein CWI42_021840 [Ordospora colligata]|uniref:Uncharacterized protein n=1 Tax=Ordospora colligata OC4 TaxID=1354746 RepID=A0A0B2UN15_9MICR|nr:uncharacterized protein M896_021850 [Ordospora colligata OC4]KHN70345.1 hypothetical protein M896_021850 [Ordospora colligata OC4]TBU16889.1 hypothetical protein CWI41_021860 [Ordospora colligata]TBU16997.1 hypothetical protein CWI40_021860 [Ordospora colligata]TBU19438.1 hypothetical protein CWI42_021840 [Ordospora colligata]
MAGNEISDLVEKFSAHGLASIDKLELLVGIDKMLNDALINHLGTILPEVAHLDVCEMMLLEEPEKTKPLIERILNVFPSSVEEFVGRLLRSSFYTQRQAVAWVALRFGCEEVKSIVKACINDTSVPVVRSTVSALEECDGQPFNDDELADIVEELHRSWSECVQCMAPDVIVLIKKKTRFVAETCVSNSWRRRYAIVKKIEKLCDDDIATVYLYLSEDPEEEIRICLAKSMEHVKDWSGFVSLFLRDSSPTVRALAIQAVGCREEFQEVLKDVISDGNWEVRKALLCVQKAEMYRNVVVPLINSLQQSPNWRMRKEVLESIVQTSKQDERLLYEFLSKYLLGYLHDRVHDIRKEASISIGELVKIYSWTYEWHTEIETAVVSKSYLHRITSVCAALSFDEVHGTNFIKRLLNDKVVNVKLSVLKVIDLSVMDQEIRSMVMDMCESNDRDLQAMARRVANVELHEVI